MWFVSRRAIFILCAVLGLWALVVSQAARAASDDCRIVVWVRAVNETELRLRADEVPALRNLARTGVSLPRLAPFTTEELVASMRRLRTTLGDAFREVGDDASAASSEKMGLAAKLGRPPPVSDDEREALRRLREARGDPAPQSAKGDPSAEAAELESSGVAGPVLARLAEGARLVLVMTEAAPVPGNETRARDRELAELVDEAGIRGGGRAPTRDTVLILVLVPSSGRPALIASGPRVRNGRVVRRELTAAELSTGAASLLGLQPTAVRDSGDEFRDACLTPGA